MKNSKVEDAIESAERITLKEAEEKIGACMLLGVAIDTINNFKRNLKEELKNERSKKFSK